MADSGTGARKVKSGGGAGTKLTRKEVIALGGGNWSKGVGMINKGEVSASQVAAAQIKAGKVGTFGQDTTTRGQRSLVTKAMRSNKSATSAKASTAARKTDLTRARAYAANPWKQNSEARANGASDTTIFRRSQARMRIVENRIASSNRNSNKAKEDFASRQRRKSQGRAARAQPLNRTPVKLTGDLARLGGKRASFKGSNSRRQSLRNRQAIRNIRNRNSTIS